MRKPVGFVVGLALLVPGPMVPAAAETGGRQSRDREWCRGPAALPDLGAERPQQQPRPSRDARVYDSPSPIVSVDSEYLEASDDDGGEVIVTASRAEAPATLAGRERSASWGKGRDDFPSAPPPPPPPPPSPPPPPPPPAPPPPGSAAAMPDASTAEAMRRIPGASQPDYRPQSGLLTAGEHDDLLNPELYAQYVRNSRSLGQTIDDLPKLDTGRLLTVEVRDGSGRPVPFAPVTVRCADGNELTLNTMADGRAVFFPLLDRLSPQLQVRAGDADWREVAIGRDFGGTTLGFTLGASAPAVRKLDLALVVDVTGSMGDELNYLQSELRTILDRLSQRHRDLDIRIGFSFYRDQGDDFVTLTSPLSGDFDLAQSLLAQQRANGGGDYEEAMQDALVRAAKLDWRSDAVKTVLLVGDAPPHDDDFGRAWIAAENLRAERVHVVPVGASGVADKAEYLMRAMAAATQSRYTFLTDDSGIGNAHAAPAIDCYLVTRLDALITRIIDSQISGRRIEPEEQDVIRSVGTYDAGKCILPPDWKVAAN
jgi:hypothetical protein